MIRAFAKALAVAALGGAFGFSGPVAAQTPKANGETMSIRHASGSLGNMHVFVAAQKGFCERYNFKCQIVNMNNALTSVQTVVGGSLDVGQGSADMTAAAINAGAEVVIVGTASPNAILAMTARADVPLPNKAKGYPDVMKDLKGLKIGVPARGAAGEVILGAMLRDAGLNISDVTVVATGGPDTAYNSMVVGKQVDAVIAVSPAKELCEVTKACVTVVDMPNGQGPDLFRKKDAAGVVFVMRRKFADDNPALMAAFYAAMKDAAKWFQDPANLDEVVALYKPVISFKNIENGDVLLRNWIKDAVKTYSPDLSVNRDGIKAAIDFAVDNKMLPKSVDISTLVWSKAP
jgi:NitT/TauT family transport system substrate-binding protein